MSTADNQKLDPSQVLAIKHRIYLSGIKAKALQEPSLYFQMRQKLLLDVEQAMCESTYSMFYDLLKSGTIREGTSTKKFQVGSFELPPPEVPTQKINDIALQVSNHISHIILPESFNNIVESKMALKTAGSKIDA